MNFEFQLPTGWEWSNIDTLKAEGRSIVSGPFGSNIGSRFFVETGVPVIRGNNLSLDAIRFKDTGFVFLTDEKAEEFRNCEAHTNDLIFTAAGTIGQVGIIPPNARFQKYIISNKQLRARLDTRKIRPIFAYYWLSSPTMIQFIQSRNTGSTIPLINLTVLKSLPIPVPPLLIQDAIVQTIEPLDNRISLLRETNTTLEAIAQTLFKSWFVDFDPVKAKAEGRLPEGMDEATAALFPSEFEESALGLIPKGWRVSSVNESFILTMGQSPSGSTYNESGDGLPFYQGRTDFGFRFPTQRIFCNAPTRFAEIGDTLVSVRAPVGDVNMALERCCIGRGVASVRHPLGYRGFIFYSIKNLRSHFELFESEGTVFGSINKKDFQELPIIEPINNVLKAFDEVVSVMDDRITINEEKLRTLTTIRDTLLPRLISGQLRLNQAQEIMDEVGA